MTAKADVLMLTDAECAKRIGLDTDDFKSALPTLERSGFPVKDPLFNQRRYWPAVQAWLDRRYGLAPSSNQSNTALDGEEKWK